MPDPVKRLLAPSAPGSPLWWRARLRGDHERNRRPRADGITLERVTAVAVALAEDEGLEAVTMRRVARELGTGQASLYRHVASRDELLAVVSEELLASAVTAPDLPPGTDWRTRTERHAHEFRRAMLAKPALIPLITAGQLLGPDSLKARDLAMGQLLEAGFPPRVAVRAYLAVAHYVIGAVQLDNRSIERGFHTPRDLRALFAELEDANYPNIRRLQDELSELHPDDEFQFGLDALLDGIEALRH